VLEQRGAANGVPGSWLRALLLPLVVVAWLALLLLILWVLSHFTKTILMVVLAAVLAFAFTPLATVFNRWMPRPIAISLAYLVGLCIIIGFGAYVVATAAAQVSALVTNVPDYARQAQSLQPRLEVILSPFGITQATIADLQQQLLGEVQIAGTAIARDLLPRLAEFFGTVIDLVLVLILSIYLAIDGARVANWLKTETPRGRTRARAEVLVAVVNRVVGGYIRGVLTLALLIGVLVGAGLALLGVPYAVLLGVLAFFMEFVPVLGVFISGVAAVAVASAHFQEPVRPLIVLGYFVVVHIIEGDVVGPRIMGKAVGIHPATGLIALVAGTEVFGIWGALFAAPLAGLIQSIVIAAWIELRGGHPHEVLETLAEEAVDKASETANEKVAAI
jgi:predicted PurR-regulated permease PerM